MRTHPQQNPNSFKYRSPNIPTSKNQQQKPLLQEQSKLASTKFHMQDKMRTLTSISSHASQQETLNLGQSKQNSSSPHLKPDYQMTKSAFMSPADLKRPRYDDMKRSFIQDNNDKKPDLEEAKGNKRMPRMSEPILNPMDTQSNSKGLTSGDKNKGNFGNFRKKSVKESELELKTATSDKNLSRFIMRKSTMQPGQTNFKLPTTPTKMGKPKKITISEFEKIKQLGSGKYGKVFLVREKSTNFICAIKVICKKLLKEEEITEQFIRELKIQMFLNHPNIIKMYGYFDDIVNIYIVLEVGFGGQLLNHLKKGYAMHENKAAGYMRQVCQAVAELHSNQIIHRDIKPQNIVLHENVIKLCDFGWSVYHGETMRNTFCGTPLYVCPQILKGKDYNQKIDIWSLGIMMYEMLIGQNPFNITKEEQLFKIIKDKIVFPSYVPLSVEARDFLQSCLQKNPEDRKNIRQLLNHQFFKKYPEKSQQKKIGF